MQIIGIGCDIENIKKFKSLNYNKNKSFYNKIFTKREIKYCLGKSKPYLHFTGRFCAKEAIIKALGTKKIFQIKDVEIINNQQGGPKAIVKNRKTNVLLSISYCDNHTIAFCLIYK